MTRQRRETDAWPALLAIDKAGSIRGACRETGHSYRTLTRKVGYLERQLGFTILQRDGYRQKLSNVAAPLVSAARNVERAKHDLDRLVVSLAKQNPARYTVRVPEALSTFWVIPRLNALSMEGEHVRLVVQSYPISSAIPIDSDIYISSKQINNNYLIAAKFARVHFVLCMSENYAKQFVSQGDEIDLKRHKLIINSNSSFDVEALLRASCPRLSEDNFIRIDNSSAHFLMIQNGVGIGFIATYALAINKNVICINGPTYYIDLWLSYKAEMRKSEQAMIAVQQIKGCFRDEREPWFLKKLVWPR